MKIKICGLSQWNNLLEVAQEQPDYIGLIFYPKSARLIQLQPQEMLWQHLPKKVQKVGVFVNESVQNVAAMTQKYHLDYVQLHGNESASYCEQLKSQGIKLIKAFGLHESFDFEITKEYTKNCEYFLWDTAQVNYGGSGIAFDWSVLTKYKEDTPFFLSGGIGLANIHKALQVQHPQFKGLDINSKIEDYPGFKNIQQTKHIIQIIKNYEHI